jgi:hypothetical protein
LMQAQSSSALNQYQYPASVLSQYQNLPSAATAQGLYNSSIGLLPAVQVPGGPLLSGGLNLLQPQPTSTYPTINELYSSLNQLPPMRSSISLQNLHQGTFW